MLLTETVKTEKLIASQLLPTLIVKLFIIFHVIFQDKRQVHFLLMLLH